MKTPRRYTIMVVDDSGVALTLLIQWVQAAGFTVQAFTSAEEAWEFLINNPRSVDIALLDKIMPRVSGFDLLKMIKANEQLWHIPVIIQTADTSEKQMQEGLEIGAHYYLTKPFQPEMLAAILHSAANECAVREELMSHVSLDHAQFMRLMHEGDFVVKTHAEAGVLAAAVSQASLYPEFAAVGLMELLCNAIEHGNLEIGYQRKNKCLLSGHWKEELEKRFANPLYGLRVVHVHLEKTLSGMHVSIRDEGKGFDWTRFVYEDKPSMQLRQPNGRGIAKAFIMLDDLRYTGCGNEVHCNLSMPAQAQWKNEAAAGKQQHIQKM